MSLGVLFPEVEEEQEVEPEQEEEETQQAEEDVGGRVQMTQNAKQMFVAKEAWRSNLVKCVE